MMWKALIATIALSACVPISRPASSVPDNRIAIVGYNDMDEMLGALTDAYRARHPGVTFTLSLKSTRSAPPALIDGSATLAPMGAAMTPGDIAAYRRRWHGDPVVFRVAHASLARDALSSPTGVFVARDNPVEAISLEQLRGVFARGAREAPITRWGQLGATGDWADRPIHPVGLGETTAIAQFLLHGVLAADGFVPDYRGLPQSREVAAAVVEDPLALGLANLGHARAGIRALVLVTSDGRRSAPVESEVRLGRYPLDRHLLIYARRGRDGRIERLARDMLSFILSDDGQRIVAAGTKGYLALSDAERRLERKKLQCRR